MIAYNNGSFIPLEECQVPVSDLGLQRGYGIFDFFRALDQEIIWKDDYFDRLFSSIRATGINIDINRMELEGLCRELQVHNQFPESTFKVLVTGGQSEDMGSYDGKSTLIIIQKPFKGLQKDEYQEGINLITHNYQRPEPEVKTLNYFFSLRLHKQMHAMNAMDVLYHTDQIRETSRSNFFGIKNGVIHTPKNLILKGITRKHVLKLASKGFSFEERDIFFDELPTFEEAFITGTSKFIVPVATIDGKKVGDGTVGKITRELMESANWNTP